MTGPDSPEEAVYDQLLVQVKAKVGSAPLQRIEAGFREYYRADGRGDLHLPGLTLRPWWDASTLADAALLERSYPDIRVELEQLLARRVGFQPYDEGEGGFAPYNTNGGWNVFYFRWDCHDVPTHHAMCPKTSACVRSLPNLGMAAFFSALSGGVELESHTGSMGVLLTIHMGLIVPAGCTLRVGDETRRWKEGTCLAFQDTFEHEARNSSRETRFILMLDVWHPELTPLERHFLERWARLYLDWEQRTSKTTNLNRHVGALDGTDWWKMGNPRA